MRLVSGLVCIAIAAACGGGGSPTLVAIPLPPEADASAPRDLIANDGDGGLLVNFGGSSPAVLRGDEMVTVQTAARLCSVRWNSVEGGTTTGFVPGENGRLLRYSGGNYVDTGVVLPGKCTGTVVTTGGGVQLALHDENVYASDGTGGWTPAFPQPVELAGVHGAARTTQGDVVVLGQTELYRIDSDATTITALAAFETESGPTSPMLDPNGDFYYVDELSLMKLALGASSPTFVDRPPTGTSLCWNLAMSRSGTMWGVCGEGSGVFDRQWVYNRARGGTWQRVIELSGPVWDTVVTKDDRVFVVQIGFAANNEGVLELVYD